MKWPALSTLLSDYGTILVLLVLCVGFSLVTLERQYPANASAGETLAQHILSEKPNQSRILILARNGGTSMEFTQALEKKFTASGLIVTDTVMGQPVDARKALEQIGTSGQTLDAIAADHAMANFCNTSLRELASRYPALASTKVFEPRSYRWPNFLKHSNLLNIMKQISVVAIIAIGMTLVIITAGIDLSVGSLIAFSGVVAAWMIRAMAGAETPTTLEMLAGSLVGIMLGGIFGFFSGAMVTVFRIPAFIVTLGVMFMARGLGFIIAESEPIVVQNDGFDWLGQGHDLQNQPLEAALLGIPNSVALMAVLFILAHILMNRTSLGRHIYAVGGNPEAARLSGVPVRGVLLFVYALSGLLAGLGGIMEASLHNTGDPKAGTLVELQVIAAVVVGGASLAGGQGKIIGTLIGALIIAVIRNGMNLAQVESHMQSVVYGGVILVAVLLDQLKNRNWKTG